MGGYLLDTHVLLWYIDGDSNLSVRVKEIIQNPDLAKFISIASLWEIAIKLSKDKLLLTVPFEALIDYINVNGFSILPIEPKHLFRLKELPNHHGDPFDRLLIAQTNTEELTILSIDRQFSSYQVSVIW